MDDKRHLIESPSCRRIEDDIEKALNDIFEKRDYDQIRKDSGYNDEDS